MSTGTRILVERVPCLTAPCLTVDRTLECLVRRVAAQLGYDHDGARATTADTFRVVSTLLESDSTGLDARVAAQVIDVKPNGNLVIQARKQIIQDGEIKDMVLSGTARQDDVTTENTVLSSQLADLRVDVQHEGELKKSSSKGIFTRALETLFAF